MRVNFVVWGTDGRSVLCACSIRFITERTLLCKSICIILLQPVNTRVLTALCELTLVIPRCGTDQFSRSFLSVAERLSNFLPSNVWSGGTWSSFKSTMNLCPRRALLDFFPLYILVSFCCSIDCLASWFCGRSGLLVCPFPWLCVPCGSSNNYCFRDHDFCLENTGMVKNMSIEF